MAIGRCAWDSWGLMSDRNTQINDFLEANGWGGGRRQRIAGDASFRRYERIELSGETIILMDAPAPMENVLPFIQVDQHLRRLGYSAPMIYAEEPIKGLLLLEDLGDRTFTRALAEGADEIELYSCALDLLIDLHSRHIAVAVPNGLEIYDEEKFLEEAVLFTDWYMPQILGQPTSPGDRARFLDIWHRLLLPIYKLPETIVLRDFHADNLMWLPDRDGIAACGLLDFQDAIVGPHIYDVMSLLDDARRDVMPGLVGRMMDRYLDAFPVLDKEEFRTIYVTLAAQRHCKVIGIFTRLAERDSKYGYLVHIPRVWRLLDQACRHPVLAPLKTWLDDNIPLANRQVPAHRREA